MITSFTVKTKKRIEAVDITAEVRKALGEPGIREGICCIYVPHTTAGITINEGADPDVMRDFINKLNYIIPIDKGYLHTEGNSDAHIKASIVGSSALLIVEDGAPLLGTWQSIFFCEFDGPRQRKVLVKTIE